MPLHAHLRTSPHSRAERSAPLPEPISARHPIEPKKIHRLATLARSASNSATRNTFIARRTYWIVAATKKALSKKGGLPTFAAIRTNGGYAQIVYFAKSSEQPKPTRSDDLKCCDSVRHGRHWCVAAALLTRSGRLAQLS